LDQDVAIKVYFDGDYNAMTLTECKKEVCIFSSLCYVSVSRSYPCQTK